MTHYMKLNHLPFEMIKSGEKTIELRLNDEKRRIISIGDSITFNDTESGDRLTVKVIDIHKFKSFNELYKTLPLLKCGYTKADIEKARPEDMDLYYSREQQEKYGVLGIEVSLNTI